MFTIVLVFLIFRNVHVDGHTSDLVFSFHDCIFVCTQLLVGVKSASQLLRIALHVQRCTSHLMMALVASQDDDAACAPVVYEEEELATITKSCPGSGTNL